MAWRSVLTGFVVVAALVGGLAREAAANGRPPGTSSITFKQGNDQEIAVGLTFGLVLSHDGGKTWAWICEDAFPYMGMYDPKYAYAADGSLYATTYAGIKVMKDSCTFNPAVPSPQFVSSDLVVNDNVYFTTSEPGNSAAVPPIAPDYNVYKSVDNGKTFPMLPPPIATAKWWQSMLAAPSDSNTLYLSGYTYVQNGNDMVRKHLLFRSDTGGSAWTDLKIDTKNLTLATGSIIDVVGVASDDPKTVFVRVEAEDNLTTDSLYRSDDSGVTWTKILTEPVAILGFVVRKIKVNGKYVLVAGTQTGGSFVSTDSGATWKTLAGAPHISCLTENLANEIWACTQNYGTQGAIPSDDAGVMKTSDLTTWTKVLRYQDLTEAASCGADTIQAKTCVPMWCAVCKQLNCTPAESYNCPKPTEAMVMTKDTGGGCCDVGSSTGTGALALGLVIGTVLLRPRRRRQAPHEPGARCP